MRDIVVQLRHAYFKVRRNIDLARCFRRIVQRQAPNLRAVFGRHAYLELNIKRVGVRCKDRFIRVEEHRVARFIAVKRRKRRRKQFARKLIVYAKEYTVFAPDMVGPLAA
ncbi:hypothetical protein SDC9_126712 [bioreactor metagenome]|uniref:Uncharacterized protein n=1 Tax=bioreactor metagenome TaxID=1076179 RepID=A0A645CRZ6_9ZZZZ